MSLGLAAETAKVIFETKPNEIGFLMIRADGLIALALDWTARGEVVLAAALVRKVNQAHMDGTEPSMSRALSFANMCHSLDELTAPEESE